MSTTSSGLSGFCLFSEPAITNTDLTALIPAIISHSKTLSHENIESDVMLCYNKESASLITKYIHVCMMWQNPDFDLAFVQINKQC